MPTILAIADVRDGIPRSADFQVFTVARKLAEATGQPVVAAMLGGGNLDAAAQMPGTYGIGRTLLVEDDGLAPYSPDVHASVLTEIARQQDASVILAAATVAGKDLLPRVAQALDAGLAQDCTDYRVEGGSLVFTRPMYAGKLLSDVRVTSTPVLATLRPKAFDAEEAPTDVQVERLQVEVPAPKVVLEATPGGDANKLDVTEADILVSGGRGMQGPENWGLLEDLAEALGESTTLACSRPVSDDGWRPHGEHVGQTGKTVAPDLYIACGISGAIQHVAGIASSKYIVAINKDPDAPIFKIADYGIVGDLFDVLPALTEEIRKAKG